MSGRPVSGRSAIERPAIERPTIERPAIGGGEFLRHDGIWVGEKSKGPNIGGIRKQLVEEMRQIKPSVVRYPGGCFADSYDWRDGIGPVSNRPYRTNFWEGDETVSSPA